MKNWRRILSWRSTSWSVGAKVRVNKGYDRDFDYLPRKMDGCEGRLVSLDKSWSRPEEPLWLVSFSQYSSPVAVWQKDLELI
jgi:hypothetical protein